ncbi:MAG: TRAP transporter substrate-binding protein [Alphaproteobacteria bacterium]
MKALKSMLLAGAAVFAAALPAQADTVITIGSWAPPTHGVNSVVLPSFASCVKDASKGKLTAKIEYPQIPPPDMMDSVRDGVIDMTWFFHGYNLGRYVATQLVELPGLGVGSEAASIAYWRIHNKHLAKLDEHKGVMLISLMVHGAGVIQTKTPITKLADLKGMKIRVPGGIASAVGKELGVVGVNVPAPKVYETLSSGVADGVFMPFETSKSFRLREVVKNFVIIPGGMYYGSFGYTFNPDKFKKMSKDEQAALMACSGEKLASAAGKMWDIADNSAMEENKKLGLNVKIADAEMTKEFAAIAKKVEDQYIAMVGNKFDAKTALAELRQVAKSLQK